MASSVNKHIILGNLGADPESRSFQNGGKVVNFRVATTESWKDRTSGERKERTEWHSIQVSGEGLTGVAEKYLRKGSKVYIEGVSRTRKWQDQNGNDRYSTEIHVGMPNTSLMILDRIENGSSSDGYDNAGRSGAGNTGRSNPQANPGNQDANDVFNDADDDWANSPQVPF